MSCSEAAAPKSLQKAYISFSLSIVHPKPNTVEFCCTQKANSNPPGSPGLWDPLAFMGLSHTSLIPYFPRTEHTQQPCKTGSLNASLSEMDKASAPQGGMWAIGNFSLGTNVLPETYTCSFFRLRWQVARQVNKAVCTSTQLRGDLEPKWGIYLKDKAEPLELSGVLDLEHQIDVIRQVYCCI